MAGTFATPMVDSMDLPDDVDVILQSVARWSAGYSGGLKWNEKEKLKADMMNRPFRWRAVEVAQVHARSIELGLNVADADTVADLLQRMQDGRRFNVRNSYRDFHWGD